MSELKDALKEQTDKIVTYSFKKDIRDRLESMSLESLFLLQRLFKDGTKDELVKVISFVDFLKAYSYLFSEDGSGDDMYLFADSVSRRILDEKIDKELLKQFSELMLKVRKERKEDEIND